MTIRYDHAAMIGLDWGTTNVRAALLDRHGNLLEERRGESGVGQFTRSQFETRFDELTEGWPLVPVVAAGMVGSKQGWVEAEYLACPASPQDLAKALKFFKYKDWDITIVPGIKFQDVKRHDVMRGEESQIAGFLASDSDYSGCLIMPGTHSKWVTLQNGRVVDFRTYMTGELFEALSKHSILRHSVTVDENGKDFFTSKVQSLVADGNSVEGDFFGLRARHLLEGADPIRLRQELSALLITAEIRAGVQDGFSPDDTVILIGAEGLTEFYRLALEAMGRKAKPVKGTTLVWPALHHLASQSHHLELASA